MYSSSSPSLCFFFFFFSQGHLRSRQEGRQMHQLGNCNLLLADLFSVKFRHSNLHSSCWALLLNLPDPLRLPEGSQELSEEHRASCCCQGRTPTGGHNFQQALAVFNKLCQLFLITGCSGSNPKQEIRDSPAPFQQVPGRGLGSSLCRRGITIFYVCLCSGSDMK